MSKARENIEKILSDISNGPNPEECEDDAVGFKIALSCIGLTIPIAQLLLEVDEKVDKLLVCEKGKGV